jgi:predicted DNA-binding protein
VNWLDSPVRGVIYTQIYTSIYGPMYKEQAVFTSTLLIRTTEELMKKIDRQARRENRTKAEFIRRVIERYIEDKEFAESTSQKSNTEVRGVATDSMAKNQTLLDKLADS